MKRSGYYFIEAMPKGGLDKPALAGTAEPDNWIPYKLWAGDLWECRGCGAQIVSGTGAHPLSEHYKPEFEKAVDTLGAKQLQVNDC